MADHPLEAIIVPDEVLQPIPLLIVGKPRAGMGVEAFFWFSSVTFYSSSLGCLQSGIEYGAAHGEATLPPVAP